MSKSQIQLASLLLQEHFGEVIEKVAVYLIKKSHAPLRVIVQETSLSAEQVKKALYTLLQHNIGDYEVTKKGSIEYSMDIDAVLLRSRFPRYVYSVKTLYGDAAELLVEEILQKGQMQMTKVVGNVQQRLKENQEEGQASLSVEEVKEKFKILAATQFIQRCPTLVPNDSTERRSAPVFDSSEENSFVVPEVRVPEKRKRKDSEDDSLPPAKRQKTDGHASVEDDSLPDQSILWRVNTKRFHYHLRDQAIVAAVCRKIDKKASEIVRAMLRMSETKTAENAPVTDPLSFHEILQAVSKELNMVRQTLEQYLSVLVDDSMGFVVKTGDHGGGMYSIHLKNAMIALCQAHVESVVQERFGSKCFRIFRVLLLKKQLEQKQIEEFGMVPAKVAKELLYKLFGEQLVSVTEVSKTPDHAPARTFFLFSVNLNQVARILLDRAYKTMANLILRRDVETKENKRLLEKQQRVEAIAASLEQSGADPSQKEEIEQMITPPERKQIAKVKHMTDKLEHGELQLDETICILQLYLFYAHMKT